MGTSKTGGATALESSLIVQQQIGVKWEQAKYCEGHYYFRNLELCICIYRYLNGKGRYVTNPDGDLGAFLNPHEDYGVLPEKALPSRFTCKEEHKGHQEHYQHVELSTEGILDLVRLQCKVIWCVKGVHSWRF